MTGRVGEALGGAVGATARAALVLAVARVAWAGEVGVLFGVNLVGAYALGWLVARGRRDARWRARTPALGTGVAGALTTFSGLAAQLVVVAGRAGWPLAAALALAQVAAGVGMVVLGLRHGAGRHDTGRGRRAMP